MRPQPFRARFVPRSSKRLEVLRREAELAEERLGKYDGETKVRLEDFF